MRQVGHRLRQRWPSRQVFLATACAALFAVAGMSLWWIARPRPATRELSTAALEASGNAARGRLVFAAADCGSCHASPGQADPLRLGGGLALASPYGTFRVPNISQDKADGIGRWQTADLANALLSGVSPNRRHYYPVFPYASYAHMTLADVIDLMAYLRTLPAVAGRPPPHDLTFPFDLRLGIGLWKLFYFDSSPLPDDPARNAAWNRGRYLVESLGHCAECHSPRNLLGAIKSTQRFAGGRDSEGTGFVPNITATGLGRWSEQDIVRLLEDGQTPDKRVAGSSMRGVVDNAAMLSRKDREAIAVYVKSLRPKPTATP